VIFASEEFVGEGTILDLSVSGCAVHSDIAPLSGDYVQLHVVMPDEKGPIEVARAKVVWAKQQRFGVEFRSQSRLNASTPVVYICRNGVQMTTALFARPDFNDDSGHFRFVAMWIFNPLSRDCHTTLHDRGNLHIRLGRHRHANPQSTHAD
jgi:hypothetical protein